MKVLIQIYKKKIDRKYQFLSKAINTKINEIRIGKLVYVIFNLNHAVTYIGLNGVGGGRSRIYTLNLRKKLIKQIASKFLILLNRS